MLNPFPIQYLALFAYFILRTITGLVLLHLARRHWDSREELFAVIKVPIFPFGKIGTYTLITTELISGIMLIFGFYTQIAALLLIIMSLKIIFWRKLFSHSSIPDRLTYVLLLAIGLSLFITGAGVLAFDLPI